MLSLIFLLKRKKSDKGDNSSIKVYVDIPESTSSATYEASIETGGNTFLAENVTTSYTINQYAPAGINVSFSSTTSTSLIVTGTSPVAINGIETGSTTPQNTTINWTITKSGPTKIYAHRQPIMSQTIAYNTDGSSDWTNTQSSANGGTEIESHPTVTQTDNNTVTLSISNTVVTAGTANVSPVLNLDNFISTTPPAFDAVVSCGLNEDIFIDLGSENNTIPVSSAFMTGGGTTISSPSLGTLGSYGAYDGATPGVVTYTGPNETDYEAAGSPESTSFTYRLNDGTTFSATKTVTIQLKF